ncbi:MAG: 30S ribosomal protein S21 [Myxococcota bacterium]|jgi:small subunit ribosomal protein S21|nr:30S ribosomal protein S21 [Myxococcota bacterium]
MTVVQVRDGDPVEKALRKFRRKVEQAGIRKEVRKREYYLKPGEQRRKKEREAQRRRFKAIKKAKQGKGKRSRTFRR